MPTLPAGLAAGPPVPDRATTELWWQKHLNGNARSGRTMKRLLDKAPWDTDYAFTEDFNL